MHCALSVTKSINIRKYPCYGANIYLIGHLLPGKIKDSDKGANSNKYQYQISDKAPLLLALQNMSAESPTSPGEILDVLERTEHHCLW